MYEQLLLLFFPYSNLLLNPPKTYFLFVLCIFNFCYLYHVKSCAFICGTQYVLIIGSVCSVPGFLEIHFFEGFLLFEWFVGFGFFFLIHWSKLWIMLEMKKKKKIPAPQNVIRCYSTYGNANRGVFKHSCLLLDQISNIQLRPK